MSDYDLLTKFMKYTEEEAERIISRNKIQKLDELKIQIIGQNPQLLGVGTPGTEQSGAEIGTEAGGPNPMVGIEGPQGEEGAPPEGPEGEEGAQGPPQDQEDSGIELEQPSKEDIKKYNLGIEDYNQTIDDEDIDWSEED